MEWLIVGVFGLLFGSFLNVLIVRMPRDESVCFPASHCPMCRTPLRWWHNIPLFSFLFLRARCSFCGAKISFMYPLIELFGALLALVIFAKDSHLATTFALFIAFALLLALSLIDLKTQLVPDSLNFSALFFALLYGALSYVDSFPFVGIEPFFTALEGFFEHFKEAALLAGALTLLRFALSSLLKREAMGEGDIIVAASMGAILGAGMAFVAIFVAALGALVILLFLGNRAKVPFIPFLTFGTFVVYYFSEFFELYWAALS